MLLGVKLVFLSDLKQYTDRLIDIRVPIIITPSAFDFHDEANLTNAMLNSVVSEVIVFGAELLTAF